MGQVRTGSSPRTGLPPCWVAGSGEYPACFSPGLSLFGRLSGSDCWHRHFRRRTSVPQSRLLLDDGWYLVATRGSHRQFRHRIKSGRVTVPGKPGDDLAPGTLNSILNQSGLKKPG
ncbi:MAG: type II toxin-antitoxin system HicA family toxin [Chromatiales bacterium]|nr:type II toxin-antitoxin system HicA family toxin [Chromatiales bacterium]